MTKIVFSPDALSDLQEIKTYIIEELNNENAAANTVAQIMKRIRRLSEFPKSGASLSSIIDIDTEIRFLVCGNYLAFYQYVDGEVCVLRVLYGKRNFVRILFRDETVFEDARIDQAIAEAEREFQANRVLRPAQEVLPELRSKYFGDK